MQDEQRSAVDDATRTQDSSGVVRPVATTQPELFIGAVVGRYRVRRLIGEGGMGRVYLARDVTLGRSVALKLVRPDRMSPGVLLRLGEEARVLARLNHPHIVVLYDVGEHRGWPWLAMEYLDGESLRERGRRGAQSVDEALRAARAIADALAHAHAAGVHHCDLKPSNVVLPGDGRLRVVDFGLSRLESREGPSDAMAGTPDWMAPEQWLGEPLTDRVDTWALGVMVHELLSDAHPFGAAATRAERARGILDGNRAPARLAVPGLPAAIADLVLRSLQRTPAARPSAVEWREALDAALHAGAAVSPEASPYRGLAAFSEEHAHLFFGREPEIETFLERIRDTPVLPIVGPSGAGKSSFLNAGVLPRLHARERWTVVSLRPGANPFGVLAHRLLAVGSGPGPRSGVDGDAHEDAINLAAALRETPTLLALRLSTIAAATGSHVLLAVDQMEEVFTQGASAEDVTAFLDLLIRAADDPGDPVRVVITIRDDFLGRIAGLEQLFVLRKLGAEDLRRTITGPLEGTGYQLESSALIEDILADIGDISADLPLVQFACRALWDARDRKRKLLLSESYRALGGVAGALARHAEGCLAELTAEEQRVARPLLTRLVAGTNARRVVPRGELVGGLGPAAERVLDRLLAARLVTQRRLHGEEALLVELAHESLLQSWGQLAKWLEESKEERRLIGDLEEAASLWHRRGRRDDETWTKDDLRVTRGRLATLAVSPPPLVDDFLRAGEEKDARQRRASRARLAVAILVAAAVTVGSIALASSYRQQKLDAERQGRAIAEQNEALRQAKGNLGAIDLVLAPFELTAGGPQPAALEALPELRWQLHGAADGNPHQAGAPLPAGVVETTVMEVDGARVERVVAPGGLAFLRVDGRGRNGERCGPSWLRVLSLPGYADKAAQPARITVPVPTCDATRHETVHVPAGPFVYGGPGEPRTRFTSYEQPERVVDVAAFRIDVLEVSNRQFGSFAELAGLTGYAAPVYSTNAAFAAAAGPDMPVAGIDAFTAEAFCRFMGKRLPTDFEWTKAARGGLDIAGSPNPHPRRLFPWGPTAGPCANIEGAADGSAWMSPVTSLACGASPYSVLNLAGNVAEWIAREGQTDTIPQRVVRGGGADSPPALEHHTTVFRNSREARSFWYTIGVRCVEGEAGVTQ